MDRSIVTRTKTGCSTCRIRKVKCDETRPFCKKCVSTGRKCEGYASPIRLQTIISFFPDGVQSDVGLQRKPPTFTEFGPQDIDLLNHYFSTKTMFDVKLACDEEAKQILQASLTDAPMRHAILSLKALREDLEASRDSLALSTQQTPGYDYGLHQYNMALRALASNLSSSGYNEVKSALLCCQIFISIEQARANYAAMAQHITQGLSIMHEFGARPKLVAPDKLVPARHEQIPFVDIFVIKLFAAPCKFAVPPTIADGSKNTLPAGSMSFLLQPVATCDLRKIAPDMRTELKRIAASILEFLNKVAQVKSVDSARALLSEKAALQDALVTWLTDLRLTQRENDSLTPEPLSLSFMRIFHQVLNIVLLRTLDFSLDIYAKLQTENDRLQDVANQVNERVSAMKESGAIDHAFKPVLVETRDAKRNKIYDKQA